MGRKKTSEEREREFVSSKFAGMNWWLGVFERTDPDRLHELKPEYQAVGEEFAAAIRKFVSALGQDEPEDCFLYFTVQEAARRARDEETIGATK